MHTQYFGDSHQKDEIREWFLFVPYIPQGLSKFDITRRPASTVPIYCSWATLPRSWTSTSRIGRMGWFHHSLWDDNVHL